MRKSGNRTAVVAGGVAVLFGIGVAFAAWTTDGEGTGTATAGEAQALTVTVNNVGGLFPTGTVDVPFTVTNPNPYAVELINAQLKNVTVDAAHSACEAEVVSGALLPLSEVVPANGTGTSHDFAVSMSNEATDACQGAVFSLTLSMTGLSSN